MAKRSSKRKKKEHDANVTAFRVVQEATGQDEEAQSSEEETPETRPTDEGKNPAAVELGRLGGRKGGKARAAKLTPEQRREIARKAAQQRWSRRQS